MAKVNPKSFDRLARQIGIPARKLREIASKLFEGLDTLASAGAAFGLSVSAIFSEAQIAELPASIRDGVRGLEATRSAKRAEILATIARSMGQTDIASANAETRAEMNTLVEVAIDSWEWEAELNDKAFQHFQATGQLLKESDAQPKTELQRLLKEHYKFGVDIHSFVDGRGA